MAKQSITIRCTRDHGCIRKGAVLTATPNRWGVLQFENLPSFTAAPILSVDEDGKPTGLWKRFEIV